LHQTPQTYRFRHFCIPREELCQSALGVTLTQKLLNNELKIHSKKYLVQSRSFAEMLEATIRKYQKATQTVLEQAKLLCGDWTEQV